MKAKTGLLVILALGCGLGASYLTAQWLAHQKQEGDDRTITIFVAKRDLDMGTPIANPSEIFEAREVRQDSAPAEGLQDVKALQGMFLKRGLRKGDHVTVADVQAESVTLPVPPGMHAVGIRVNLENSAHGFASLPRSRVDIHWTARQGNKSFCMRLLKDVLVLAADIHTKPNTQGAMPASVVTLALTRRDVQKVNLAKENGLLHLALRGPGQEDDGPDRPVYFDEIVEGAPAPSSPNPPAETSMPTRVDTSAPVTIQFVCTIRRGDQLLYVVNDLDAAGNVLTHRVLQELPDAQIPQSGLRPAQTPTPRSTPHNVVPEAKD